MNEMKQYIVLVRALANGRSISMWQSFDYESDAIKFANKQKQKESVVSVELVYALDRKII